MNSKSPEHKHTYFHKSTLTAIDTLTFDNTYNYLLLSDAKKNVQVLTGQINAAKCALLANTIVLKQLQAHRVTLTKEHAAA